MRLLIDNVNIIPMTVDNLVMENGYILIDGNHISNVGVGDPPNEKLDLRIDGSNQVAIPGFINAHTHAAMTLLRGYADDMPLMDWLEQKIWPLEAKLSAEDIYWGTMLALVEMIKSGTTCFADMYFAMDRVAEAVDQSGMRAVLARGMIGVGPENELAINDSRDLIKKWNGAGQGRIRFNLGPHAPYTCPPDYLVQVMKLAGETGVGMHIHLAETQHEINESLRLYGMTPIAHMESLGMFNHHVLAAHCVHLTAEDISILVKYGAGVVHNPESNMKLASGIAPVPEMLAAGIPVALGTDGASSNNNLDMLQEMRTCALLHKVNSKDPTVLPAYQALQMATVNGARALRLDNEIGTIETGKKADIILLKMNEAHWIPRYDIVANLVYSAQAADVNTVIVNGQVIMQDRHLITINENEVLEAARRSASRFI